MTEAEVYTQLNEVFREVFMRDDVSVRPDTTAKDIDGWDSFRHIELLLLVQERFNFKFTAREMDSMQCVGDMAKTILSKST